MTFQLNASLAVDSIANEADVRTLKSALNRLGYYMPYDKTGITDMPDTHMFDALKKFQSEHGLSADGIIRPDGPTFQTIKTALEAGTQNQAYIWKTVKDNRVRGDHAAREGKIFLWNKPPDGGHPAQDYNCRCWAEPPVSGRFMEGVPSRQKPRSRGEKVYTMNKVANGDMQKKTNITILIGTISAQHRLNGRIYPSTASPHKKSENKNA